VVQVDQQSIPEVFVGATLKITARVFLGHLTPADVRVQIYQGAVDPEGRISNGSASDMTHTGNSDANHVYEGRMECCDSGSRGYSIRVIAFHPDAILPYEQPWLVWEQ
jgi:starch phosphorylase